MATQERSRSSASDVLVNLLLIGVLIIVGWLAWPSLVTQFYARTAGAPGIAPLNVPIAPQAAPAPAARPFTPPAPQSAPQTVPTASLAQIEATSMAVYQATVQAVNAAPVPNTDTTNDSAPLLIESKAVPDRQPAPAVVPIAEPLVPAENNDQFGSKPAIINPQRDHVCLHGAVWTDTGCHYPTPTP